MNTYHTYDASPQEPHVNDGPDRTCFAKHGVSELLSTRYTLLDSVRALEARTPEFEELTAPARRRITRIYVHCTATEADVSLIKNYWIKNKNGW
jgi:hypothetical protein